MDGLRALVGVGRQSPQLPIGAHCRSDGGQRDDKPLERVEQGGVDEHAGEQRRRCQGLGRDQPGADRDQGDLRGDFHQAGNVAEDRAAPGECVGRGDVGPVRAAPIGRRHRSAEASRRAGGSRRPPLRDAHSGVGLARSEPADLSGLRERHQHQQRGEAGGDGRQDRAEKRERQKHQRQPGRIERGDDGAVGQCPRKASERSRRCPRSRRTACRAERRWRGCAPPACGRATSQPAARCGRARPRRQRAPRRRRRRSAPAAPASRRLAAGMALSKTCSA